MTNPSTPSPEPTTDPTPDRAADAERLAEIDRIRNLKLAANSMARMYRYTDVWWLRDLLKGRDAAIIRLQQERDTAEEARLRAVRVCKEQIMRATREQFRADSATHERDTYKQLERDAIAAGDKTIDELCAATREAEALREEVGRLQKRLVNMTDRWHAAVEMGVEADKEIARLKTPAQTSADDAPRPMIGFFASLTPEQQAAALAYRGPDDLTFKPSADDVDSRDAECPGKHADQGQEAFSIDAAPSIKYGSVDDVERARKQAEPFVAGMCPNYIDKFAVCDYPACRDSVCEFWQKGDAFAQQLDVALTAARAQGIAQGRAGMREAAVLWHQNQRPILAGPEYGLASEGERRAMRERNRFHESCAAAIRLIPIDTPTGQGDDTNV